MIKAGLALKVFPGLKEVWNKVHASKLIYYTKRENRSGAGCNTYLYVGFSNVWSLKIHSINGKLRDSTGINWLRILMSYHRYPDFGEIIQRDSVSKLIITISNVNGMYA